VDTFKQMESGIILFDKISSSLLHSIALLDLLHCFGDLTGVSIGNLLSELRQRHVCFCLSPSLFLFGSTANVVWISSPVIVILLFGHDNCSVLLTSADSTIDILLVSTKLAKGSLILNHIR
jgi:hypothetical protein